MESMVAKEAAEDAKVSLDAFLAVADKVIGLANHSGTSMRRRGVHFAFLYGTARYGAFDWQNGPREEDEEGFIAAMLKRYEAMLREQLADTRLKDRPASP